MTEKHVCVAIYADPLLAEEALSRLQGVEFGMEHLSFVGRDYWADGIGSFITGGRVQYCGRLGPFWEKLWSILHGWGVFWAYENGPMLVAGPLSQTIIAANDKKVEDPGVNGTDDFEAGLRVLGVPADSIVQYAKALLKNQILLFILGSQEEITRAQQIIIKTEHVNNTLHFGIA